MLLTPPKQGEEKRHWEIRVTMKHNGAAALILATALWQLTHTPIPCIGSPVMTHTRFSPRWGAK